MEMKIKYETLTKACMIFIIFLYTGVLFLLSMHPESWGYEGAWIRYLFNMLKMSVSALLLTQAFRKWILEKKRREGVIYLIGAFVVSLFGVYVNISNYRHNIQNMLVTIWPIVILAAAFYVRKNDKKFIAGKWNCGALIYYAIATAAIWFIEDTLIASIFFKREILEVMYLLILSVAAWYLSARYMKQKNNWCTLLFPAVSLGILFLKHERISDIIRSFANPITSVSGVPAEVNWLGHRIVMMRQAWSGKMELLGEEAERILYNGTLVVINDKLYWWLLALILVAEIVLLYSLYKIYQNRVKEENTDVWMKMVFYAILLWSVIGIFAEVFIVTSTSIGLLLLGNTETLVMILFFILLARSDNSSIVACKASNSCADMRK